MVPSPEIVTLSGVVPKVRIPVLAVKVTCTGLTPASGSLIEI